MQVEVKCPQRQTIHWRHARIGHIYKSTRHEDHYVICVRNEHSDMGAVVIKTEQKGDVGNSFQPGLDTCWIPCDAKLVIQPMG